MSPAIRKNAAAAELLEQAAIRIRLDPRREGVVVPPDLRTRRELELEFGRNLRAPIPDLDLSEEAISGTLCFDATGPAKYFCWIPWEAVFAVVADARGAIWPDDVPDDLRRFYPRGRTPKSLVLYVVTRQEPPPAPSTTREARPVEWQIVQ